MKAFTKTQGLPKAILVFDGLWPVRDGMSESDIMVVYQNEDLERIIHNFTSCGRKVAVYELVGEPLPGDSLSSIMLQIGSP